jgi:hypothetical protein
MSFQSVSLGGESVKQDDAPDDAGEPYVLIPEAEHLRRLGGISRVTAHRKRKSDPTWPRVIKGVNGYNYYIDTESRAHVKRLIEASS